VKERERCPRKAAGISKQETLKIVFRRLPVLNDGRGCFISKCHFFIATRLCTDATWDAAGYGTVVPVISAAQFDTVSEPRCSEPDTASSTLIWLLWLWSAAPILIRPCLLELCNLGIECCLNFLGGRTVCIHQHLGNLAKLVVPALTNRHYWLRARCLGFGVEIEGLA
jgi:hypothetical protein